MALRVGKIENKIIVVEPINNKLETLENENRILRSIIVRYEDELGYRLEFDLETDFQKPIKSILPPKAVLPPKLKFPEKTTIESHVVMDKSLPIVQVIYTAAVEPLSERFENANTRNEQSFDNAADSTNPKNLSNVNENVSTWQKNNVDSNDFKTSNGVKNENNNTKEMVKLPLQQPQTIVNIIANSFGNPGKVYPEGQTPNSKTINGMIPPEEQIDFIRSGNSRKKSMIIFVFMIIMIIILLALFITFLVLYVKTSNLLYASPNDISSFNNSTLNITHCSSMIDSNSYLNSTSGPTIVSKADKTSTYNPYIYVPRTSQIYPSLIANYPTSSMKTVTYMDSSSNSVISPDSASLNEFNPLDGYQFSASSYQFENMCRSIFCPKSTTATFLEYTITNTMICPTSASYST
jgi:hypothetical protein